VPAITTPEILVAAALDVGRQSTCAKSKRGVAILTDSIGIVCACNDPPLPFKCDGSRRCREFCRRLAVHAEQRALLIAGADAFEATMLHVKVVDGELADSGPPSCYECSKLILEAGIADVWLFHSSGWRRYEAAEFHRLSLAAHNLPRISA
jgi:deoxycytidylate deaminase